MRAPTPLVSVGKSRTATNMLNRLTKIVLSGIQHATVGPVPVTVTGTEVTSSGSPLRCCCCCCWLLAFFKHQELDLGYCSGGHLPTSCWSGLTALTRLSLSGSGFVGHWRAPLRQLPSLTHLELRDQCLWGKRLRGCTALQVGVERRGGVWLSWVAVCGSDFAGPWRGPRRGHIDVVCAPSCCFVHEGEVPESGKLDLATSSCAFGYSVLRSDSMQ